MRELIHTTKLGEGSDKKGVGYLEDGHWCMNDGCGVGIMQLKNNY